MKRKITSVLLALALCLSLLPTAALAEEHTCADEDHDHRCDTCGEVTYQTEALDSGYYACAAGCSAVEVSVSGDYTELNYHGLEEGTLVDGTAEISVSVPNYHNAYEGVDFEPAESGTVTVFWTDAEGSVLDPHTVEDAELVNGKATVSFTDLPIEMLHRGNLLYTPADNTYLPAVNGMVLQYQDNAYQLTVDSLVGCTINGVYEDELYLFAGTEVSVIALSDAFGTLTWSYEEDSAQPEYTVMGSIVNFTMPEGDVQAILEYDCVTCFDEDSDHWCDFCDSRISECGDEDGDHYCDVCWEYLSELCTDGEDENIHVCDTCWAVLPDLCADEDDDHRCDLCDTLIEGVCHDDNDDHYCDNEACRNEISVCEDCDGNEDNICDFCGEGIYPNAGDLNVEAEAGDGTITVTWDALEDAGADKVASYTVSCCLEESFEPLQQFVYEPGRETYSHTFSGLKNNVVYDVSVEAEYTQAKGSYTATTTVTALPGAPTILSVTYGNGSVTVEWEAPENKGFPDILYYVITAEQNGIGIGAEVEATGEETMRCTLDGLLNGESYQIYVSAVNNIGQGASATTTVEIPLIPYQLEIGGVAVTEENMNDVLGDGTVSLNPHTSTLTLNNAQISVTEGNYGIRSKTFLTLELIGENSIACAGVYGLHSTDDVTVCGSGSLDVTANDVGIYIAGGYEVGGLYLKDDVTLNVTSGNVSSGNSYGVRVDDVLEVRDNATLIAAAGTAPERSCGIYAYDECNVYDNAVVTATGADQSVDLNTDCDGIRTTHITIHGGTVTATGGTAATTNGIFTQTFDMHDGTLTAVSGSTAGGTCFGPSAALQATRSFNLTGGVINATSGSAGSDTSCGVLVSNGELKIDGGSLYAVSGEANFSYGIKATQLSLSDGYISAEGAEGVWCSAGISVEGSLSVSGGTVLAKAADAETYSYGIQTADNADIIDADVSVSAGSAANSYGIHSWGTMYFDHCGLTASAETAAVYAVKDIILDDRAITAPVGGHIAYNEVYQHEWHAGIFDDQGYALNVEIQPYLLYVGGAQVTANNAADVLGDGTVSYDMDRATLTLTDAAIAGGYEYEEGRIAGIYAVGDLNIELEGSNSITAPDGFARSYGIRVSGDLSISGDGSLTAQAGDATAADSDAYSTGIHVNGQLSISDADVTATGGTASAENGTATSRGVYVGGGLDLDFGGSLTAKGGSATGIEAFSIGIDAFGDENECLNIAVYEGWLTAQGGDAVAAQWAESDGLYMDYCGLYVYENSAYVTLRGGSAKATSTDAAVNPYACSNGVYVYAGDVDIEGGTVTITGGSWDGLSGNGWAVYVEASEPDDSGAVSGGNVNISSEEISPLSNRPGFTGTKVTFTATDGTSGAVYAKGGIEVDDALILSAPEGGKVTGIGGSTDPDNWTEPDYYVIEDANGELAQSIAIEPLLYEITIEGLAYGMGIPVPVGLSANETYCEKFEVDDLYAYFAPATEKDGYTFLGFYTEAGEKYDFDAEVTGDITLTAKWRSNSSSGGGSSTYSVTVEDTQNGDITVSPSRASSGSTVTITVDPDAGYTLETLTVLDKNGKEVELTKKSDTKYTFKMPSGRVTIDATFMEDNTMLNFFMDVPADSYYYDAVLWAAENGITGGTGATTFSPYAACTRAQTVTFLWRAAGSPEPEITEMPFTDVRADAYYYKAVLWAVENGVTAGTSATTFSPDATVTRSQNVTFLWRWAESPAAEPTNSFSDIEADAYYYSAVAWAAKEEITSGTSATTFSPNDPCLRSQIVTFLYRYMVG